MKPASLKLIEGKCSGQMFSTAPKPRPVRPSCPQYMDEVAHREWRRVVPELERLGILTCVDGAALEVYCNAYSNMVRAQKVLNDPSLDAKGRPVGGFTFSTPNGCIVQRPEVGIVNQCSRTIKMFCAEFGFTPTARARMDVGDDWKDEDDMGRFLSGAQD